MNNENENIKKRMDELNKQLDKIAILMNNKYKEIQERKKTKEEIMKDNLYMCALAAKVKVLNFEFENLVTKAMKKKDRI